MGRAAQATDGEAEFPPQLIHVLAAPVLQFASLQEIPDTLVGVEVGRGGGQALEVQALGRARREEVLDRLAVMNRRTVPDHQQLAAHLAHQLAEEGHDRRPADGLVLHMGTHPSVRGHGADHRAMVVRQRGAQDRRLSHGGGGTGDERQQREPGLVYEADGALLGRGFAPGAGQVSSRHARTFASSRWLARWIGFWTLSPSFRSRRLLCAGW